MSLNNLHNIKNKLSRSPSKEKNQKKYSIKRNKKLTLSLLIKRIFIKFKRKYKNLPNRYETNIIDNIIYNEKSHIVAKFKDSLIVYDFNDYLKRYYTKKESKTRLHKYFEYYNLYSKLFPNYTPIPERKYFYLNIQRKQVIIDLQEQIENGNLKEKNDNIQNENNLNLKEDNVFNTSVVNSILNRTNKEEMEILFDLNYDKNNENIFIEKINKLIDLINIYEIKEEYYIDYNYESKKKKIKNKETISPLMNININYINFNKFNEDKTNSNSICNQSNKNIFLYKLFKIQEKDNKNEIKKKKHNSKEKKDYSVLVMKINQLKRNNRVLNNINKFKYLPIHKNNNFSNLQHHSFINNQSYGTKKHRKNKTIVYEIKNKSLNNNLILTKNNKSLKNLFSYKSPFGVLCSINNNNFDSFSKLSIKSPLTSRNKKRNEDINLYLTNKYYNNNIIINNKNIINSQKENKSILSKKENNFYKLINNSRNKISLNNNNISSSRNNISCNKYKFIQNSISPSNKKIKLKERKKIKQNNSFLNKTFFNRNKLVNNHENNKNKNNIAFNNFIKESIISKNSSLIINRNYSKSIKGKNLHHGISTKNIKYDINKKNIKKVYINKFLKAFNNNLKVSQKILSNTQREYKK